MTDKIKDYSVKELIKEIVPLGNNVLIKGISVVSTLDVNAGTPDKGAMFRYMVIKLGKDVKELKVGDEVILRGFPSGHITVKGNPRSLDELKDNFNSMPRKEFEEFSHGNLRVPIAEYFITNEFDAIGINSRDNDIEILESVESYKAASFLAPKHKSNIKIVKP
jgi:hypothetical protein